MVGVKEEEDLNFLFRKKSVLSGLKCISLHPAEGGMPRFGWGWGGGENS